MAKIKLCKNPPEEKKTKKSKKIFKILGSIVLFFVTIFLILFCVYKYYHFTTGFTIYFYNYNYENEYGKFLIESNDAFIENMVSFDNTARSGRDAESYSQMEKDKLSNIIVAEGEIISKMENNAPSDKNADYEEVYVNMLKSYALYIQGQTMQMEYIFQTEEGLSDERFVLGESITKLVGNFIIEYAPIVNEIRGTNYYYKYSATDMFDMITGDFEQIPAEYDEDGNLILDEDKNYLFLPEGSIDTSTEVGQEMDSINTFINNYFNTEK